MPRLSKISLREVAYELAVMAYRIAWCDHCLTCPHHTLDEQATAFKVLEAAQPVERVLRQRLSTLMAASDV